jgi:uncharacterized repeat protein (TIGR01451 family)
VTGRVPTRQMGARTDAGWERPARGRLNVPKWALVAAGSVMCLMVIPTRTLAAAVPSTPHLTLTKSVDRTRATVGSTLMYTVTLRNSGALPASNVIVADVLGGDAGFIVNDGTRGTVNSFAGSSVITVTKVSNGHYHWTYATVNAGASDIVRFTAVITLPPIALSHSNGIISLTNTASAPGVAPVTVTSTAPYAAGRRGGGAKGIATGTPRTGISPDVAASGAIVLVGLGLILLGMFARKAEQGVTGSPS